MSLVVKRKKCLTVLGKRNSFNDCAFIYFTQKCRLAAKLLLRSKLSILIKLMSSNY